MRLNAIVKAGWMAVMAILVSVNLQAADQPAAPTGPRQFSTSEDAIAALQKAAAAADPSALESIFGPEFQQLLTGDKVQDENNAKRFAAELAQGCRAVTNENSSIMLEIGTNHWPMPIPLVLMDGRWHFDTPAGREEIINRHVGRDELHAIGVCRAYVAAQKKFSEVNSNQLGGVQYALKFKSTPGTTDGLYWQTQHNGPVSPFAVVMAEAHAEGYGKTKGRRPPAFHGYFFKILTRQGPDAPGGRMNYLVDGSLVLGFALVAYPEHWDESGVMTFIVNQDGQVYQKNLGEKTVRLGKAMTEYNPGPGWTLVDDPGVIDTVPVK